MGAKRKHLIEIGQKFNFIEVISEYNDKEGRYLSSDRRFNCKCVCGNSIIATVTDLFKGKVKSCGCKKTPHNINKYVFNTGDRICGIIVKELYKGDKKYISSNKRYLCQCECGNELIIMAYQLAKNKIIKCRSCSKLKHGKTKTPEFRAWNQAKRRCYNASNKLYEYYGGRGIRMCERWLDKEDGFKNFLDDMGFRPSNDHSLDRKDVNGHYSPENCRWTTRTIQNVNKRKNHSKSSSEYIGVRKIKTKSGFHYMAKYGKIHLGTFDTEIKAAQARDEYVIKLFKNEFVSTNKSLGLLNKLVIKVRIKHD